MECTCYPVMEDQRSKERKVQKRTTTAANRMKEAKERIATTTPDMEMTK